MTTNSSVGIRVLLDFIGETETGVAGSPGYGVIYGNNQDKLSKPLTAMTLSEILKAQTSWTKRFKSSAAGRYQFMRATLKGLKEELGLPDGAVFTASLQDRLAVHLLERRGLYKWLSGDLADIGFALNLAKEWASFPVLDTVKGNNMMVSRGQSYYAGDALNKALVPAVKVEAVLREVKEAAAPTPPKPAPPIVREVTKVVAPEGLDKPMLKSKTLWATLTQALTGGGAAAIVSALGGLDWKVAALIIIVVAGGAYVAISERKKKANNMRELKQKVGSP